MEKKIHIETTECDCRFPYLGDEPSLNSTLWAENWWITVGQHSSYLRTVIIDNRFDKPMQTIIHSPYYTKGDDKAKASANEKLVEAVTYAIKERVSAHPDPT